MQVIRRVFQLMKMGRNREVSPCSAEWRFESGRVPFVPGLPLLRSEQLSGLDATGRHAVLVPDSQ